MAIRFTMMIAIPCAVGLGVLNSSINGLIFGAVYAKGLGAAMLRIGAVSVIFYCLSTLTNGILQGMGKMRVPVKHSAISVVVNIVVLWLLLTYTDCKTYGLVFATMAFSLVMCLLNAHSIKKYTGFHQEITKTFIKPALSAAVMGVVCFLIQYGVQSVLPFGRVCFAICVIIAVPVGALIYFAAIIKLKVFTEEELTKIPKGNFVDPEGNVLGQHKGIIYYTVGQRRGLGLSLKKPGYVIKVDKDTNEVVVGDKQDLFANVLYGNKVNCMSLSLIHI